MRYPLKTVICLFLIVLLGRPASAVELPSFFGDNMVFQRDEPITIWGKAPKNSTLLIQLSDFTRTATVDNQGNWQIELPAMKAGGPYDLVIQGTGDSKKLSGVHLQ